MDQLWRQVSSEQMRLIAPHLRESPISMHDIASTLGVSVKGASLPAGVSGEIRPDASSVSGYGIRVNRHEPKVRQRFTVGHELGHFLLHRNLIGTGLTDNVLYRSRLSNRKEAEANRIAADLLMPLSLVKNAIVTSFHQKDTETQAGRQNIVAALAKQFLVSEDAMKIRLGWQ